MPKKRRDLTDLLTITIDPPDAKDFDDAVSLETLDNGNWRLGVHIADVSHFVKPGTPLDKEAADRGTSVYLPDKVIPMLPEVLSNVLASLQPDKVRYTKSVFMEIQPDGIHTHTEIFRSSIKSKQRLDYGKVQEFYDKRTMEEFPLNICTLLSELKKLMKVLYKRRLERGALEMDIPEPKIDLDGSGNVCGAHIYPYYDSNRVIEECMLAANEAVACYLEERGIPFLRRIHSGPTERKLQMFADFVNTLDIPFFKRDKARHVPLCSRPALQRLLAKIKGTPNEYAVNFSLLRSMKKAVYSPQKEEHYALALPCYCHFTSPIRRYPDLHIHRLLDSVLDGKTPKPDMRELVLLGEHCSEREQRAEGAERELVKLKLIGYMSKHIGEPMKAFITSVETYGVFVMGTDLPAEGLIRTEALTDDSYRFDWQTKTMVGLKRNNTLKVGDRLLVDCIRADTNTRQLDFRLLERCPP